MLPLLFEFRGVVAGEGFLALVSVSGHALLELEDGETSVCGVLPCGFAGVGLDRATAMEDFRRGFFQILDGIAAEADGLEAFRGETERFLSAESTPVRELWRQALEGSLAGPRVDDPLPGVPAAKRKVGYNVELISADTCPRDINRYERGFELAR